MQHAPGRTCRPRHDVGRQRARTRGPNPNTPHRDYSSGDSGEGGGRSSSVHESNGSSSRGCPLRADGDGPQPSISLGDAKNKGASGGVASVGDVGVERDEVVSRVSPGVAGHERSEKVSEDADEMGRRP